jgi:hypothetical protein
MFTSRRTRQMGSKAYLTYLQERSYKILGMEVKGLERLRYTDIEGRIILKWITKNVVKSYEVNLRRKSPIITFCHIVSCLWVP